MIDYKFNEPEVLEEIAEYIDATYGEHYAKNKFQATEFILDAGHGEGFCIGNIMKYAQRFGKKDGKNRKDYMKIIHYAIIGLKALDLENEKNKTAEIQDAAKAYVTARPGKKWEKQ